MASLEISTAPGSCSLAPTDDKNDTAAAAPPIGTTHLSTPDEKQLEQTTENQAKESKESDKGKGRHKRRHGVMSLPAEIRETYALQSST